MCILRYADGEKCVIARPDPGFSRAENIRLKRENEILKKATAYFARDVQ